MSRMPPEVLAAEARILAAVEALAADRAIVAEYAGNLVYYRAFFGNHRPELAKPAPGTTHRAPCECEVSDEDARQVLRALAADDLTRDRPHSRVRAYRQINALAGAMKYPNLDDRRAEFNRAQALLSELERE